MEFPHIGARAKRLREALGLDKIEVARRCGIHRNTYLGFEKGQDTRLSTGTRIAEVLGVSLSDLVRDGEEAA